MLSEHPHAKSTRLFPFALDITKESLNSIIKPQECHFITMVFFLSAIAPSEHVQVLRNCLKVLSKGGLIIFRDYARYDMTQLRNHKKGHLVSENFYKKKDGIQCFYFTKERLETLAKESSDQETPIILKEASYSTIILKNKKEGIEMHRVFISGVFQLV